MNWKHEVASVAVGLMLLAPRAFADSGSYGTSVSKDEAMTLWSIYKSNQSEKDMATLARSKTRSQEVKDVSDRLLEDYKTADAQVRAYAKKRQIDLDALARQANREADDELELERRSRSLGSGTGEYAFTSENAAKTSREADASTGRLRKLDGSEFDRAFARDMVADHQTLIDQLANTRPQASDEMKSLIDGLLPDMKQHLDLAQKLASNL